jgi:type II secretory pathway pseudopilin PulG
MNMHNRRSRVPSPRTLAPSGGFTLVEMLVSIVLTLILVTAIAEFYAIVGDSVKDGRAIIEMGGQLRAAVERLKSDLDLITVSVVPWTDDGSASGYFEYLEGRANDYDADGDFVADSSEDGLDASGNAVSGGNGIPDVIDLGVTNTIGDGDDFLAFTIRSSGAPFTGRYTPVVGNVTSIVSSPLAEVVWWVSFEDRPVGTNTVGNGIWDFNEPRELHRRQLLIRPELGQIGIDFPASSQPAQALQQAFVFLRTFWQTSDISASIRAEFSGGNIVYRIRANSLADLTKREYRFAHYPLNVIIAGTSPNQYLADQSFPHSAVTTNMNFPLLMPSFSAKSAGVLNGSQTTYVLQGTALGEDLVLSNILAFDVQVYDPCARIWPDNPGQLSSSTTALVPSDPGYSVAAAAGTATSLLGLGAFVDLAYYRHVTLAAQAVDTALNNNNGFALPYFAGKPDTPLNMNAAQQVQYRNNFGYTNYYPYGATYDTWALSYERDGIDQFGSANGNFDLQTNGLDDLNPVTNQYEYGVDDANERETVPPYSQPLRGIQVKIRLYEPSTRQVRQATVGADFITE